MVSISEKKSTVRKAIAIGKIWLPQKAFSLLLDNKGRAGFAKGDVLGTARIAGIMAAKKTGEMIPLCHPLGLSDVKIGFELVSDSVQDTDSPSDDQGGWVKVRTTTECEGKTGVEMEALMATSTALLTVWDMVKALCGKEMRIEGLMVVKKEGGKSGDWVREGMESEVEEGGYED